MQPMAQQAAGKVIPERELSPQRLKPHSKQCSYRSGKPLRHPKSRTTSSQNQEQHRFSANW
jgi:hypothetical protein